MTDLRDIMKSLDEEMSDEDLEDIIAEIDTDGSGTVDFEGTEAPSIIRV